MQGLGLATGWAALLWATAAFGQWPVTINESNLRAVLKGDATVIVVPEGMPAKRLCTGRSMSSGSRPTT